MSSKKMNGWWMILAQCSIYEPRAIPRDFLGIPLVTVITKTGKDHKRPQNTNKRPQATSKPPQTTT